MYNSQHQIIRNILVPIHFMYKNIINRAFLNWNSDKKYSDTKVLNVRHERTWSLMFSKNLFYCLNYGNKITKFF